MKWYDYIFCFFIADTMSAMIFSNGAAILLIIIPLLAYFSYESLRADMIKYERNKRE